MGYDSLTSDTEHLQRLSCKQLIDLRNNYKQAMRTIGNLDERLTSLESMVNAALFKQQDDIKTLIAEVNSLKGKMELEKASNKFDMDAVPAQPAGALQLDNWSTQAVAGDSDPIIIRE